MFAAPLIWSCHSLSLIVHVLVLEAYHLQTDFYIHTFQYFSPGFNPYKIINSWVKYVNIYSVAKWQLVQVTYKVYVCLVKVCGKRQVSKGVHSIYSSCSCSRWVYTSVLFIVVKVRVNTLSSLCNMTSLCTDATHQNLTKVQFCTILTFHCSSHYLATAISLL